MSGIPLTVRECAGVARICEIVTVSVPLPQGCAAPGTLWRIRSPAGESLTCQATQLATWPDATLKWAAFSFPVSIAGEAVARYELDRQEGTANTPVTEVRVREESGFMEISTGRCDFRLPRKGTGLIERVVVGGSMQLNATGIEARFVDRHGARRMVQVERISAVECGPLRCRVGWTGRIPKTGLNVRGEWTFWAGSPSIALDLTIHNPSRARHHRGCWDLGDPGSILFRSLSICMSVAGDEPASISWREQPSDSWKEQTGGQLEIRQETSGGENDDSRTHIGRNGKAPQRARGYVVRSAAGESRGLRAEPICAIQRGKHLAAAGLCEFWQQFPKALEAADDCLHVSLYPEFANELHELQGGEQKTTRVAFSFGAQSSPQASDLIGVLEPLEVRCDATWLASTQAIPRLPNSPERLRPEWHTIAQQAIAGKRSFFAKRELVDEYGWRNFGDLWADHEEAYFDGPRPIVSHYNNQYDALEALLLCYLLTGDRRYWELAGPLARHVMDIDIYHTTQDRAAYNGGQFWHTNHYRDAATSTHRAYSAVNHPEGGGGPSNEQNYSSGLLLYYHLTGNNLAREAVISLADWVLSMDDGRWHILGLVYDAPTGLASRTTESSYHGPGRGAGNSINSLLDGWLATGRSEFLGKVEELVRRAVSPHDDIALLNLGDAERRWSYTVFLQTLIRVICVGKECRLSEEFLNYSRNSVLHYARWMAANETFYLDRPESLEYPTETWAAQEIRKANVLVAAAHFAEGSDVALFRKRAQWFYDRAWSSLMDFSTWHFTRPTVLALQLGLYAALFADATCWRTSETVAGLRHFADARYPFVPQKEAVKRRLQNPRHVLTMLVRLGRVWRWKAIWNTTWAAQRIRRFVGQFNE